MRVLPVLDLLDGHVVRGVAGRRQEYRPIESTLTAGSDPLEIATAMRSRFGLGNLYVADLDAILHKRPHLAILKTLADAGFGLMVDAGIRHAEDAQPLFAAGAQKIVAGLETLGRPAELANLTASWGSERVVFSLDLKGGEPLGDQTAWPAVPLEIVRAVVSAGCTQIIVLDIAHVGTATGLPTLPLCKTIRNPFPEMSIITGGGIRDVGDLRQLAELPVDAVLIASALHNGAISRDDVESLAGSGEQ
jgi:phosphoribosylformimino-5-aminoimidazole carboxamide ribotide isomerase